MSQQLPAPTSPSWFHITVKSVPLLVRSPLEWWYSHWDHNSGRSRRCGGSKCQLCRDGDPTTIRYVLLCELAEGRKVLLELREAQRPVLEELCDHEFGPVGATIGVRKRNFGRSQRVEVEILSRRHVPPIDISRLVAKLGLPPILAES